MRFAKGHGTGNDFVLLPDPDGELELTAELARALSDRHTGIGADGVIRIVHDERGWFMDHRNADGSLGDMCGNGARLFARYVVDSGLAPPGRMSLWTRAGVRQLDVPAAGDVSVDMGEPAVLDEQPNVDGRAAIAVSMGNPHVVVNLDDTADLRALDLTIPPTVTPPRPHGQNVEFVVRGVGRELIMRVHERGVGETQSCGSGVCAAVVATVVGDTAERDQRWTVDVPGGRLQVCWRSTGEVTLTGPAVVVASGELDDAWMAAVADLTPAPAR